MTLNSIHCFVVRLMRVLTKWLKLESRGFHYKVALYHIHMPIKFDDDIQRGPLIGGGLKIGSGGFQFCGTTS